MTLEEVERRFGPAVRQIVEGETKFSKLSKHTTAPLSVDGSVGAAEAAAGVPTVIGAVELDGGRPWGLGTRDSRPRPVLPLPSPISVAGSAAASAPATSSVEAAADAKAQDLQQLFVAMSEEVRIILVKLADRLHNMRTLSSMKPQKQAGVAACPPPPAAGTPLQATPLWRREPRCRPLRRSRLPRRR